MNLSTIKDQLARAEEHYSILLEQSKQGFNKQIADSMMKIRQEISNLKTYIEINEQGPQAIKQVRNFGEF